MLVVTAALVLAAACGGGSGTDFDGGGNTSGAGGSTSGGASPLGGTNPGTSGSSGLAGATASNAGASSGGAAVVDSTFTNCSAVCLVATGSVNLTISAPAAYVVGNGGPGLVSVSDTASVSITGGVLQNFSAGGIIRAIDDTSVTLEGVQILDGSGAVLSLTENAVGSVDNVAIASLATTVFSQTGQAELTVKNSDVWVKPAQSAPYNCFTLTGQGTGSLTIEDTKLHGCGTGLKGAIPKTLTLLRVELYDLSFGGMDLTTGGPNVGGKVRITESKFHDNGYVAFRIGDPSALIDFKMRNTQTSITAATQWGGVAILAANASTIAFGTLADPGGNTILGASTLKTGLQLAITAATVQAVGNTWTPNVQGADAQGKYTVVGAGAKLDITGVVTSGQNYIKQSATLTLRLAENP